MSDTEERLMKLEFQCEKLNESFKGLSSLVTDNTGKLNQIVSSTESLDKILKYVVTPLIAILGAIMGVQVAT